MPSIFPPENSEVCPGTLYVVATPIGNMQDITLRALAVLRQVDLIAAEDTRHTARLLSFHGIETRLTSFHEHNEQRRAAGLIEQLRQGLSIALVSDAGTPSVSDPGYRLVRQAAETGIRVAPIPGASAAVAALSASGLPTDAFVFVGFLSRKKNRRLQQIEALQADSRTLIFYESPQRLLLLIDELIQTIGDRHAVLARELTKIHEEMIRGSLTSMAKTLSARPVVKGECTLLVSGCPAEKVDMEAVREEIHGLLEAGKSLSETVRILASQTGLSKKQIYAEALKVQASSDPS
ncbi:MAG: 16S rRNA (cytidine(1402)-2'-O)-methyltransferase [Desulfobacterales bacterium]|jgi:16S rRNA (cytidine1402-2'-O)-methyltransferase|nr:16S rRNA (cytidine(1402)-2'-O)-methyltransferase [Desulfobacterales bacterium]MDD3082132.1 16S rRNA (cytidine(1402)-2'-O)-methyltransferase [Desulfobacterales bacterium]MDD3950326.1 16S rRNA (cytidine(1402)-2'-O)-methyltransferase [Desulfobacterales bacterium]MDY0377614.1 16S rRNA (cytidine(1402)-2'-O)-methyltransferase [Desulfobacterales bacterium]